MATFETVLLTNQGETLLNREIADQVQLKFTHMAFSSDDYSNTADSDVENLTQLTNASVTAVPTTSLNSDNITKVRAYAVNTNLTEAFYVRTYALYVTPSDTNQEVLFGIVATQNPDFLPAFNGTQVSQVAYTFNLKISRTDDIHFDDVHDIALTVDDLNSAASNAISQADSYTDSRLAGAQFSQYAVLGSNVSFASAQVNGVQVADVNMLSSAISTTNNANNSALASLASSAESYTNDTAGQTFNHATTDAHLYTDNALNSANGANASAFNSLASSAETYANSIGATTFNHATTDAHLYTDNAINSANASNTNYVNQVANNTYNNALRDAENYTNSTAGQTFNNASQAAKSYTDAVGSYNYSNATNYANSIGATTFNNVINAVNAMNLFRFRGDCTGSMLDLPFQTDGYWNLSGNMSGGPSNFYGYGLIEQKCNDFDKFLTLRDNNGNMWINHRSSGNWDSWKQVQVAGNFNTVDTGFKPTGN